LHALEFPGITYSGTLYKSLKSKVNNRSTGIKFIMKPPDLTFDIGELSDWCQPQVGAKLQAISMETHDDDELPAKLGETSWSKTQSGLQYDYRHLENRVQLHDTGNLPGNPKR
jgi:hypothetical protein